MKLFSKRYEKQVKHLKSILFIIYTNNFSILNKETVNKIVLN